jgi:PTS system nitrogen regulatory IIA component
MVPRFQAAVERKMRFHRAESQETKAMPLADILTPDAVFPSLKANNKKLALQELAAHAARITGQDSRKIFEILLQRERLGSTGVGNGVAIPHGKLANLSRIHGVFARLETPIDFESLDGKPVDLIFLLLAPEDAGADHLKALALIARLLRDDKTAEKLRATGDAKKLYEILIAPVSSAA